MVEVRGPAGGSDGWSAAGAGDEEHLDGLQRAARSGGYLRWPGLASGISVYCVRITFIYFGIKILREWYFYVRSVESENQIMYPSLLSHNTSTKMV